MNDLQNPTMEERIWNLADKLYELRNVQGRPPKHEIDIEYFDDTGVDEYKMYIDNKYAVISVKTEVTDSDMFYDNFSDREHADGYWYRLEQDEDEGYQQAELSTIHRCIELEIELQKNWWETLTRNK